jgi:hypothetical protein
MRYALAIILTSYFSVAVQAQAGPAQVTQQVQQVECRDLSVPNNYLAPNETMINGKACRPAGTLDPTTGIPLSAATPVATTPAPTPTPTATATPTRAVPATAPSDGKTRVFVTDSQSWERVAARQQEATRTAGERAVGSRAALGLRQLRSSRP